MGHVFAAWRLGHPVSAPIFIPGFGALILSRGMSESAFEGAVMGYGGPLFGAFAAVGCWAIYGLTNLPIFLGLALIGFLINLFNMIPVFPLDGGWITGAVSPYIWVVGLLGMLALVIFGHVSNPFIFILILLSLPRIVGAFRKGSMDAPGRVTTGRQRIGMGIAYVGLCAFLAWGVARTHEGTVEIRQARHLQTVQ
jgi:Zn-dependent protease